MPTYEELKRMVAKKEGHASRTMMKFLGQPIAERLRGKDPLIVLDFGSGDCVFTVGIGKALAVGLRPSLVDITAVNADEDCCGHGLLELHDGKTQVNILVLESLHLSDRAGVEKLKSLLSIEGFDLVTMFNPSPPDEILDRTREMQRLHVLRNFSQEELDRTLRQVLPDFHELVISELQGSPCGDCRAMEERISKLRSAISFLLMKHYSTDTGNLEDMDPQSFCQAVKRICLERVFSEAIPHLLAPEGILFMAFDDLVPPSIIRCMLIDNGYSIGFNAHNDPENVFLPNFLGGYNRHLIAAVRG